MMYEVQFVDVRRQGGLRSVVQIITKAPASSFGADAAFANSFILSDDGESWVLMDDLSDEGIDLELGRLGIVDILSWRRLDSLGDLEADEPAA